MSDDRANPSTGAGQTAAAVTSYPTWDISMGAAGGSFMGSVGPAGGFTVDYQPGTPLLAAAEIYLPADGPRPLHYPTLIAMQPGLNQVDQSMPRGGGFYWSFAPGGGAATFDWNVAGWQLIANVISVTHATYQIATEPGTSWQLSVQIASAGSTTGVVTLLVDGVPRGPLSNGEQVLVAGAAIMLDVQIALFDPQDYFTVSYTLLPAQPPRSGNVGAGRRNVVQIGLAPPREA
jgi:hypothetical protein